uniref:Uncharacterized protein n=1 Tax=Rhabditophanes sp. KR3021 TaxID=114890 RepID=A0AC35UEM9_9BILA
MVAYAFLWKNFPDKSIGFQILAVDHMFMDEGSTCPNKRRNEVENIQIVIQKQNIVNGVGKETRSYTIDGDLIQTFGSIKQAVENVRALQCDKYNLSNGFYSINSKVTMLEKYLKGRIVNFTWL